MPELTVPYVYFKIVNPDQVWHLYVIQINLKKLKVGRNVIFEALRAEGIGVNVHYIPVHLQPYYRDKLHYNFGDFPIAENYYS
ncbi:unnamed protein product, partial [marine sediment metagenome]